MAATRMLCMHFINCLSSISVREVTLSPCWKGEAKAHISWSLKPLHLWCAVFQSLLLYRVLEMLEESFLLMVVVARWCWANQKHSTSSNLQKLDLWSAFSSFCRLLWQKGFKKQTKKKNKQKTKTKSKRNRNRKGIGWRLTLLFPFSSCCQDLGSSYSTVFL